MAPGAVGASGATPSQKTMTSRLLASMLAALALPALAACGQARQDHSGARAGAATVPGATPVAADARRYLDRHALALGLGNGFRAGLDRLAVLQQPPEGATDLGQDLPAGLLRDVRCAPAGPAPAAGSTGTAAAWTWRCRVRWETVAGVPKTTSYAARSLPSGCFGAAASPRLRDVLDPTIKTYTQHPLDTIVSLRRGC
ncbi:MAG: hypothetical protein QOF86_3300 [Baekduia sp.]|jgi:hypothetical protein|nr:hypothetical protein [Baekduia sp.]